MKVNKPEKTAGVDAMGILTGSLAMHSQYNTIISARNTKPAVNLDKYFKMSSDEPTPGLDSNGTPAFYSLGANQSITQGNYRLTRTDIERTTILVPDLTLIQPGDLLVDYTVDGAPHIGIVVGTSTATDKTEIMNKTHVLSIRRGFKNVTLGTWGNPEGSFGGFTTTPQNYHVRRLLKYTGATSQNGTPEHTQAVQKGLVERQYWRVYGEYPNSDKVPRNVTSFGPHPEDNLETEVVNGQTRGVLGSLRHVYDQFEAQGFRYYRHLPPTQYFDRQIKDIAEINGLPPTMQTTSFSGWRFRYWLKEKSDFGLHLGNDFYPETVTSNQVKLIAPTDGLLWFVQSPDADSDWVYQIELPNGDILNKNYDDPQVGIEDPRNGASYSDDIYGINAVFVTNPESPRDGRVLVFSHQGDGSRGNEISIIDSRNTLLQYFDEELINTRDSLIERNEFKIIPEFTKHVKKGDLIGFIGGRPSYGAHIHLEVFEYFLEAEDEEDGRVNEPGWYRVDTITVLDPSVHNGSTISDGTQIIINHMENIEGRIENEYSGFFQPWTATQKYWLEEY